MADPPPTRGILWFSKLRERLTPISTSRRTRETQSPPATHIRTAANVVANTINNGNIIMNSNGETVDFTALNDLPTHPDVTGHLSDYFPESREPDVECIMQWINAVEQEQLALCVLGGAGVGKSTLAQHLSEKLRVKAQLAACVFFGFAPSHWGVESVLKLVAGQLARAHPEAVRLIIEAIGFHSGPSVPLDVQIEKFILDPVRQLGLNRPLVILLDALDQWPLHHGIVKALRSLEKHTALIRVVIFGRPGLEASFQKLPNITVGFHHLLPISTTIMVSYIQDRLNDVPWKFGSKPSPQSIKELAEKAGDLFIWAATICSLLEDEMSYPNPQNTLAAILQSRQTIGDTNILADLYYNAIHTRFPEPKHKKEVKKFLGALLVLQEPIPAPAFSSLASIDPSIVAKIQLELRPLQIGPKRDHQQTIYPATSLFHLSFLEYLQSAQTPSQVTIAVDTSLSHFHLGEVCLQDARRFLSASSQDYRSPLQRYALNHWATHTVLGTPGVSPDSDAEWRKTPHYNILDSLSYTQFNNLTDTFAPTFDTGLTSLSGEVVPTDREARSPSERLTANEVRYFVSLKEVVVRRRHGNAEAWLDLGETCWKASQSDGSRDLVDRAVQAGRYAAEIGYEGNRAQRLPGVALAERHRLSGSNVDLEEAISFEREALLLVPPAPLPGGALGVSIGHWMAKSSGVLDTLTKSQRRDLLFPSDELEKALALNNLSSSLHAQFQSTGEAEPLEEAISLAREALTLLPSNHEARAMFLGNLVMPLYSHFQQTGAAESLHEAILYNREALSLRPHGHAERSRSLNGLAIALLSRSQLTGAFEDLEESVTLLREALSLRPPGHPDRLSALNNLASALHSQFRLTDAADNLEESISLQREVLLLSPPDHRERSASLCNVAISLYLQFQMTGGVEKLHEAGALAREALSLSPPDVSDQLLCFKTAAMVNQSQFKLTGNRDVLDEAIFLYQEAMPLLKEPSLTRSLTLNNLSCALLLRYESQKRPEDLKEAISCARESLTLETEHGERGHLLDTLAGALRHQPNCLEEALDCSRRAVELLPHDWECLRNLSIILLGCHRQDPSAQHLALEARSVFQRAREKCPPQQRGDLEALEADILEVS
ncbi:hypothetical protein BKA70DRAFT_1572889 [Coprinopsis sp. MPI-PUGE-AT-0042]|nr:hypothetical protein BKA70DRAFT_1572889 [Coprinopsis sp. MPI-PUGE-AT-0042]